MRTELVQPRNFVYRAGRTFPRVNEQQLRPRCLLLKKPACLRHDALVARLDLLKRKLAVRVEWLAGNGADVFFFSRKVKSESCGKN